VPVAAERDSTTAARAITERDMRILGWLGRFPAGATVRQVSRRFEMGENRAYRRLKQLAGAGLASYEKLLHPRPGGVYLPTAEGLAVAGLELTPPRADLRTHVHDLGVVDVAIESELAGVEVLTERELRVAAPNGGPYAIAAAGDAAGVLPDLVVLEEGKPVAVEIKAGDVPRPQLARLLAAYASGGRYDSVVIAVQRPEVGKRVEELAGDVGVDVSWRLIELGA
jgi:hypothetical protein